MSISSNYGIDSYPISKQVKVISIPVASLNEDKFLITSLTQRWMMGKTTFIKTNKLEILYMLYFQFSILAPK